MKNILLIILFLIIFLLINQYLKVKDYKKSVYFDWNPHDWRQQEGMKDAKEKRVVFTGLVRDSEKVIGKNLEDAMEIGKYFKDYRIVLFENDSSDRTRDIIKEYKGKNDRIILLECEEDADCNLKEKKLIEHGIWSKYRMNKMADFRNRYLEYIQMNLSDWDYMVLIDWDYKGSLPLGGIMDSFSYEGWEVMVANGRNEILKPFDYMYDALAFYPKKHELKSFHKHSYIKDFLKNSLINIRLIFSNYPFEINSGFNGLAIYKISSLFFENSVTKNNYLIKYRKNVDDGITFDESNKIKYENKSNIIYKYGKYYIDFSNEDNLNKTYTNGWKCEHLGLHDQIDKIFINPNMRFYIGNIYNTKK